MHDLDAARAVELISAMDPELFVLPSQTSLGDRRSLLLLQNLVRLHRRPYVYLEVGSHLGGSLTPHLVDPQCRLAMSIDPRPLTQPDERGIDYDYVGNSTAVMVEGLARRLPPASLTKLVTFDLDARHVSREATPAPADLALIDAEHTNTAVFRDFLSVRRLCAPSAVIAFHDANLIFDGLANIEALLEDEGARHAGFFLPDNVYALLLGDFLALGSTVLARLALERTSYLTAARRELQQVVAHHVRARMAA